MWLHLHSRGTSLVGDLVAGAIVEYGARFASEETPQGFAQSRLDAAGAHRAVHMPAEDVDAIVAYLRILRQFADAGELSRARVQQLEGKLAQPLLFCLFSVLDFPVPPRLKAALFDLLRAVAGDPLVASTVWSHLEAAAVLQKPPSDADFVLADFSASRRDITYQARACSSLCRSMVRPTHAARS